MAEWWQVLPGASSAKPETPADWLNFGLKQIPQFSTPVDMAKSAAEIAAKTNPAIASYKDALPDTTYNSLLEAVVTNPSSAGAIVASLGATGALGLLGSNNKPAPVETEAQIADRQQIFGNEQQTLTRLYGNEQVLNEGYVGTTRVKLGPLEFEVPPATASTLSVHGSSGFTAPGAAPGISVKHVQNISTMTIPGTVPLYQSLGIQGQMIEFVGAFLGFDPGVLHDAHKHFVGPSIYQADREATRNERIVLSGGNPSLTPGESQVYSEFSPDPFYLPTDAQAKQIDERGHLGTAYGLSNGPTYGMGNVGSWAVSRAFEMQIRRGQPLRLVIDTGVVTITYEIVVAGFDRLYQRDDRTWYKIQGLIVGAAEWHHKNKKAELEAKNPKAAAAAAAAGAAGKPKTKRNRGNAKPKVVKGGKKGKAATTATRTVTDNATWLTNAQKKAESLENAYIKAMNTVYSELYKQSNRIGSGIKYTVYQNNVRDFVKASKVFRDGIQTLSEEAKGRKLTTNFLTVKIVSKTMYDRLQDKVYEALAYNYNIGGIVLTGNPYATQKPKTIPAPTKQPWFEVVATSKQTNRVTGYRAQP
jgi:hypothetical protein